MEGVKSSQVNELKQQLGEKIVESDEKFYKEILKNFRSTKKEKLLSEWEYYTFYFLATAEVLVNRLIEEDAKKDRKIRLSSKMLIVPTVFIIRHSIELLLKYIVKKLNLQLKKDHNILSQYDLIQEQILSKKISFEEILSEKKVNEEVLKQLMLQFINDDLSSLVAKYYYQIPLLNSLSNENYFIEDPANELFRYPEADNIKFSFSSIDMLNLPLREIRRMQEDVKILHQIRNFFGRIKLIKQ